MKLKEYIKKLNELLEKHWDLNLIYSKDDEWNSYHPVVMWPEKVTVNTAEYNSSRIDYIYTDEELEDDDKVHYDKEVIIIN